MKNFSFYLLAGSLFILGLSLGFFAGKLFSPSEMMTQNGNGDFQEEQQIPNGLFSSQTASIRGQITQVEGNKLTVKNLNSNVSGEVLASMRLNVIKGGKTTPVTDFSTLELNKEVLMSLEMSGGNYQAILIQYPQALPSLPPIKTSTQPSNQPKNL